MTLPPFAAPRPPPPPPKVLDLAWADDRRRQVQHMLDLLSDKNRMPEGLAYLRKVGHKDTHPKAYDLLEKVLASCLGSDTTEKHHIGSPATMAVLLAQQAHALQHGWEMDAAGTCLAQRPIVPRPRPLPRAVLPPNPVSRPEALER